MSGKKIKPRLKTTRKAQTIEQCIGISSAQCPYCPGLLSSYFKTPTVSFFKSDKDKIQRMLRAKIDMSFLINTAGITLTDRNHSNGIRDPFLCLLNDDLHNSCSYAFGISWFRKQDDRYFSKQVERSV